MKFEKILKFLNFKLFFFIAISFSLIGFFLIFTNYLLIKGFPLELIGLELEILDKIPDTYFFISFLYWNIPLLIVILARLIYRKYY